jgi:ADP-ribosylglycohydrolase/protein-tyrosine phosphatase
MGVPYEFRHASQVGEVRWGESGTHHKPPGTWSDDGSLMLALLDSLVHVGFDTDDQGKRALDWARNGAYTPDREGKFDIGRTTAEALGAIEAGTPAEEAGPAGDSSQSNGSLMRILPMALWGHGLGLDAGQLVEYAMRASRVTHGHPVCQVTCALYTLIAHAMLDGEEPEDALDTTSRMLEDRWAGASNAASAESRAALRELLEWSLEHAPEGRGAAQNAFWSAWTALTESTSYAETIERTIRFGNDTDTTACIAGGLAGIRWGIDGIPVAWRDGMRGADIVEPLIDGLLEPLGWRTSTAHPIRVDWVDLDQVDGLRGAPGALGMTFLPGKQYLGTWSGPWWRHLGRDVARLRNEFGTDVFMLLVEDHEIETTRTSRLPAVLARDGIELRRYPVVDMNVPKDRATYREGLAALLDAVRAGQRVVVACRGGLGRTDTAVACMLVDAGMDSNAAIELTRACDGTRSSGERRSGGFVVWRIGHS